MDGFVNGHCSEEDLAAYLNGGLSDADRAAADAHLAECHACRTELTTARRLLRARPGAPPRLLVLAAAAAALVGVVLVTPRSGTGPVADPERDDAPSDRAIVQGLQPVAPRDGDTVARSRLQFSWRSQTGEPLYRLTITTTAGQAVWTGDTGDTTLAPMPDLLLAPGSKYFWYVDALDAAGRSLTTGPQVVWIAP